MVEIRIDVDPEKLCYATAAERQEFLTALFEAGSKATTDYGAKVDFSDPLHWVIQVPEQFEAETRKLLNA